MAIGASLIPIFINCAKIGGLLKVLARRCYINCDRTIIVKDALVTAQAALLADIFPMVLVRYIDAEYFKWIAHAPIIRASAPACEM